KRSDRSVRKRWPRSSPSSAGTSSITITCGFTARSDGSHQRISWLAAKVRSGQREIGASRPLAKLDESGALALEDRPQCVTPHIGCHVHAEPKHLPLLEMVVFDLGKAARRVIEHPPRYSL